MPRLRCDGELQLLVDMVGRARVLRDLRVHRATLDRWLAGEVRPPVAVLLLLRVWASGRLPGMSEDWHGWRFDGDALQAPSGDRWTARQIAAWPYQLRAFEALRGQLARLERQLIEATRSAPRETANDAFGANPADVRGRAFDAPNFVRTKR